MKTWLLYPPFADPTQPYLSLPYLKAALRAKAGDATVVDLNVAAARHLLDPASLHENAGRLAERFEQLDSRRRLTRLERLEYLALAEARPLARQLLAAEASPVKVFQDPGRFYDFAAYRQARDLAEAAMTCLSATHFPYRFHFNQAAHVALPWHPALLEAYYRERRSPLDHFYRDMLSRLSIGPHEVVGINLTFISQIPEAFYLAQLLRAATPSPFIVMGGSCLQQMLAHGTEAARRWVVTVADAVCRFEGEEMLPALLAALAQGNTDETRERRFQRLSQVPNLLMAAPDGRLHTGPLRVSALSALPAPDYSDLDLDGYLAPSRTLLFAPTRGCYWDRCAFCDYGASREGCHGYREMDAETAADQLASLAARHGTRHFYLSVDVMAPRFSEALAKALVARGAPIRWSADFRIEKYYSSPRCELLYQSGLRAVAFGVESGSDRILAAMDKGICIDLIRSVNARFHRNGIATAWMTFSGHPGEKQKDALATARFIHRERDNVDLFILGRFGLTSGARIAANPKDYGLGKVFYCRADDFRLFPLYNHGSTFNADDPLVEKAVSRLSREYFLDHYPWAGAISTHHSFLYFLRFGASIFKKLAAAPPPPVQPLPGRDSCLPNGLTIRPRLALARLRDDQERWMAHFWDQALAPAGEAAPLDLRFFEDYFR